MTLNKTLNQFFQQHNLCPPGERLVVAVSGGADSLALLALLRDLSITWRWQLHVAHLNHGLRGTHADDDARFVARLAARWQLPVTIEAVDVAAVAVERGLGVEEAARWTRYHFLARVAHQVQASFVATGHHAADQAETVLLRLLRGTGHTGLGGMKSVSSWPYSHAQVDPKQNLLLIRPLLNTARTELLVYLQTHNLTPRYDASNDDPTFMRNRIRHHLLPVLQTYNPNIAQGLQQLAALMQADEQILQAETERAWQMTAQIASSTEVRFELATWLAQPLALQRRLLRQAAVHLHQAQQSPLGFAHVNQAITMLAQPQTGRQLDFPGDLRLTVGYHHFSLTHRQHQLWLPPQPNLNVSAVALKLPGITPLPHDTWQVHTTLYIRSSMPDHYWQYHSPWRAYLDADVVGSAPQLHVRRPGDFFYPLGLNGHRQKLKSFMIDRKIPASRRDLLPLLLSSAGEICWVCGWRIDHRCRITPRTRRVLAIAFINSAEPA